jgi:hypothetical protein
MRSSGTREPSGLSYAGVLVLGIILTVFAVTISRVLTTSLIAIVNTTTYLTDESAVYRVGNYTVAVGLPSNQFARDVVNGLLWLLTGLLRLVADPLTFALLVILSLILVAVGTRYS